MDDKNRIREAFERAETGLRTDMTRLTARVPALVAEARRRRADETADDLWTPLIAMARRMMPRLALATGLAVVAAAALHLTDQTPTQTTASSGLENLILTGDSAGSDDPLLQVLTGLENGNG